MSVSSALNMRTAVSSGTCVNIYQIARSHGQEGSDINSHWRENTNGTSQLVPEGTTGKTLGRRKQAVTGNWRKIHEEPVNTLYSAAAMD